MANEPTLIAARRPPPLPFLAVIVTDLTGEPADLQVLVIWSTALCAVLMSVLVEEMETPQSRHLAIPSMLESVQMHVTDVQEFRVEMMPQSLLH